MDGWPSYKRMEGREREETSMKEARVGGAHTHRAVSRHQSSCTYRCAGSGMPYMVSEFDALPACLPCWRDDEDGRERS
jgi:hypothetical protein